MTTVEKIIAQVWVFMSFPASLTGHADYATYAGVMAIFYLLSHHLDKD